MAAPLDLKRPAFATGNQTSRASPPATPFRRRTRAAVLDSTVVLSELMYHPTGDNSVLEWVELHNQMSVDMDLSAGR